MPTKTETEPTNVEETQQQENAIAEETPAVEEAPAAAETSDMVTMCHSGPSRISPSFSTFVLKLETYLKMAEIPYEVEVTQKSSSKGKVPFIRHKGSEIADSSFIIEYLNEKFEKNLDAELTSVEKSISRAFQKMIEENTYWTVLYCLFFMDNTNIIGKNLPLTGIKKKLLPVAMFAHIKPGIKSQLHAQGMGRHSKEEIQHILELDLQAYSDYIGENKYFMGKEKPTEIDACLFGVFSMFKYVMPETNFGKIFNEKFERLSKYTDQLREEFWADWDEKCYQEKKKEDPKKVAKSKDESAEEKVEEKVETAEKEEKKQEEDKEQGSGDAEAEQKEAETPDK